MRNRNEDAMTSIALQSGGHDGVSPHDADAMSRRGFSFRLAFSLLAALAALLVTPLVWIAAWLALVAVWEVWLAQFLTNTLVWPVFGRNSREANLRQAAIVACGAALFGAFPFLVWASGSLLGAILGVAWIGGTAVHVFAYLSNHRLQLCAGLIPPLAGALALPASTLGISIEALAASAAVLYLIGAAAVFAFDRNALLVDITKQTVARENAEATAHAKTEFLHALTHHLRTPINHIIGYAGLVEDDIRSGDADPNDAANIAQAGKTLLDLVNRAIAICQLQAGSITLEPDTVPVGELLEDAHQHIAAAAAQTGNRVVIAASASGVIVVDRDRVLECLACLSENAAKFCQNGVITFSALRVGDYVEFTVADTGAGMTEETLRRIESPLTFGDAPTAGVKEGLGLGLTLCRELARALGGELSLDSAAGRGTKAKVRVPASASSPQTVNSDPASPPNARR
jgi:signal transduction histidine kinase